MTGLSSLTGTESRSSGGVFAGRGVSVDTASGDLFPRYRRAERDIRHRTGEAFARAGETGRPAREVAGR